MVVGTNFSLDWPKGFWLTCLREDWLGDLVFSIVSRLLSNNILIINLK